MHISSTQGYIIEGAKSIKVKCGNCNNNVETIMKGAVVGPNLGFFWLPNKYHLGYRKYWLVCPVCGSVVKSLTGEEAKAFKSSL